MLSSFDGRIYNVIPILHKTRDMHTPTNYLLEKMAISDVMYIWLWPLHFLKLKYSFESCLPLFQSLQRFLLLLLPFRVVKRHLALLKHLRTGLRLKEGKAHEGGF